MKDFVFVVNTPPDEYTINEFHKGLAEILINKYGVETMKEVLKQINAKEKQA